MAEFDIAARMARGADRLRQGIGRVPAIASDGRFADLDATELTTVALLAGSTRAVLEHGGLRRDLACLRRELPRACYGYLIAAGRATGHLRVVQRPS